MPPENARTKNTSGTAARTLLALFGDDPGSPKQILPVFARILTNLQAIHEKRWEHEAITPSSILLDDDNNPEIKVFESPPFSQTVAASNPKYAVPEAFWEGSENDKCAVSDSYILGFIFYEILLGRRRFLNQFASVETGSASAWLGWHADRSRKVMPLKELLPEFPGSVSALLDGMTEKDPSRRNTDLQGIFNLLRRATEDTAVGANPDPVNLISVPQSLSRRIPQRLGQFFRTSDVRHSRERGRSGPKENSPTGLDELLHRIEERREVANKIAKRAIELEQSGQSEAALQQWMLVGDLYPSFPKLEEHLRHLAQARQTVPEQERAETVASGPIGAQASHAYAQTSPPVPELESTTPMVSHVPQASQDLTSSLTVPHLQSSESEIETTAQAIVEEAAPQPVTTAHENVAIRTRSKKKWLAWGALALAIGVAAVVALTRSQPARPPSEPVLLTQVELQSNVAGVQFTVDGRAVPSGTAALKPGLHRAEAIAEGYVKTSTTFEVPPGRPRSLAVTLHLESLLPKLTVSTSLAGAQYVLDGDDPLDMPAGHFTDDRLASGEHSFALFSGGKQVFSIEFKASTKEPINILRHSEPPEVSAAIVTSHNRTGTLYATPDWKLTLENSVLPIKSTGLLLQTPAELSGKIMNSLDGETHNLEDQFSDSPALSIWVKSLPERTPILISANVSDGTIFINDRPSGVKLRNGRGKLFIVPGKYRIRVSHSDFEDSPSQEVVTELSPRSPPQLRFTLKPVSRQPLLVLAPELRDAIIFVDGSIVSPDSVDGRLTIPITSGHHTITVKRKDLEEYSVSKDFGSGEELQLSAANMKPLAEVFFKLTPEFTTVTLKRGDRQIRSIANGGSTYLPAGSYEMVASAPDYETVDRRIELGAGKTNTISVILTRASKLKQEKRVVPPVLFTDEQGWRKDGGDWWVYDGSGYAFLDRSRGHFAVGIKKPAERGLFSGKTKKAQFVANYKGDKDCVLYSLDSRTLSRRVYSAGVAQTEYRVKHEMRREQEYDLIIEISTERVLIQDANRNVLDSLALPSGNMLGKFGFAGPVAVRSIAQ